MPIYALGDHVPQIHPDAYVHPDAVIIGRVWIGAHSSIWPGAVLRGDAGEIHIGARTSIQDNSVIHATDVDFTHVGDDCVIGHMVHLEGCTIDGFALVGSASVVLHRVRIHRGGIVAANSVLLDDTVVPEGALAVGTPAVIKEGRARPEMISEGVDHYAKRGAFYRTSLRRID